MEKNSMKLTIKFNKMKIILETPTSIPFDICYNVREFNFMDTIERY